jgi:mannose-6-phosphate isomerase-like protein (cupin superfamily)
MQSIETTRPVQANGAAPSLVEAGDNTFGMVSNTSRVRTSSSALPESSLGVGEPVVLHHADWSSNHLPWSGVFEGADVGTDVTVLFYTTDQIGEGPRLHVLPYDEIFIIRRGRAMFTIGDKTVAAQAGDTLVTMRH